MSQNMGSIGRALIGSPLRGRRGGCTFALLMAILLPLALIGQLLVLVDNDLPALEVFVTAAAIGAVASIPAFALCWYLDRRERESIWLSLGVVLWGGVVATGLAALLNGIGGLALLETFTQAGDLPEPELLANFATGVLVAPWVEETAKALAVLIIFWFLRAEFDSVRDGIVYGALAGIGFNICEFAIYVMSGFVETGTAPFAAQLAGRFSLFGVESHALWSALTGAGIGLARQTTRPWVRIVAPVAFYLLAVGGHAVNNSLGIVTLALVLDALGHTTGEVSTPGEVFAFWAVAASSHLILQAIPYGVLAWLLVRSSRTERRVIAEYLADEVGTPIVTAEEYQAILQDRLLRTRRLPGRPSPVARAIVNAQNELAFRKWHLARTGQNPANDPLVQAWRADIIALRKQLSAAPTTAATSSAG